MSSDSEIVSCLKTWTEVGEYILQGKRDPAKTKEILQEVLDGTIFSLQELRSARCLRYGLPKQRIVDEIIKETKLGLLEWRGRERYGVYFTDGMAWANPDPGITYELILRGPAPKEQLMKRQDAWKFLELNLIGEGSIAYTGYLNENNKKFFFEVLKRAKAEAQK